ncbi:MAG: response regulator [Planctomycetes bacterium]|nr:response regulator [Planctomycetota bacterium]
MLVLARRPGQKIVFPSLGIAVEVLRSRGSVMRLGIEAPDDVPVLRDEVLNKTSNPTVLPDAGPEPALQKQRRHELRNKLNQVTLRLQLLQRQLELGQATDPEQALSEVFSELSELEQSTADSVVVSTPPSVLIVEDQPNERELLATCLRIGGITVYTTGNGREAFDFLHEHELPDLVLLDMRMPDMDGPTFLKNVREDMRLHDIRVFGVSGSSRDEFSSSPLPIDGWFPKPVRIDSLLQAVRAERAPATTKV